MHSPHPRPRRPLLHAALRYGLSGAYGVELDPVKVSKAEAFIAHVLRELTLRGIAPDKMATPLVTRAPVERVRSPGGLLPQVFHLTVVGGIGAIARQEDREEASRTPLAAQDVQ